MDQEPMMSFGVILLIIIVAAFILPGIATGIVLSMMRKPITSQNSIGLADLREQIGQLREEVEQLRDEVRQRKTGPTAPGSTDIQSY
jgi:hypothetical protein